MSLKDTLHTLLKLDKTEAKFVHILRLISCMLRLCIVGAVLVTALLVLFTSGSTQVLRRSRSGWFFDETCFFFTGEENGFAFEVGSVSVHMGEETFCGLTAEQVGSSFESANRNSESTSFGDHFTIEYMIQFFVAVGYAMFFVCVAGVRVVNSVYQKEKGLSNLTWAMKQLWSMLLLTLLAAYLAFPMGAVRQLPKPADKIVLVRTPPDYATVQLYSLFFVCPFLCCLPLWTLWNEEKGGPVANCLLFTSLLLALPILACVIHGYYSMATFYLDLEFSIAFDFSFVLIAMIAKGFLWTVAVIDSVTCLIETVETWCWRKDKAQAQVANAYTLK